MSPESTNTNGAQPWRSLYSNVLDTLDATAADARNHYIGAPLPLAYQLKLQEITGNVRELEAMDPRNTGLPAVVDQTKEQYGFLEALPFRLSDKVYCRHLRATGEIKSIAIAADEDPQARIVSLHNGKLTYNWVSMNDLEAPLPKREGPPALFIDSTTAQSVLSEAPLLSPASPAAQHPSCSR
ncbi:MULTISPECIES: hypothetical protein [unclassified Pseudovibrio]|uniref:hypothetical protein n=1 Tax=unclassified Pseudovibrio TaxID=2627060 RepID=UPI0007AEA3E8|nr:MULTISPECIES: hypothetical protein [unclassified Pseudovibrio]KZL02297.1 hypothetical protein PsW74_01395 [Pseudovibrio sp. W74]KZL08159.1 hypothetical protein PsAD14_03306 [Pseudovibrio sp. Ad14]